MILMLTNRHMVQAFEERDIIKINNDSYNMSATNLLSDFLDISTQDECYYIHPMLKTQLIEELLDRWGD